MAHLSLLGSQYGNNGKEYERKYKICPPLYSKIPITSSHLSEATASPKIKQGLGREFNN
jgi:hypothetical protein